jgi:hypothetical protein
VNATGASAGSSIVSGWTLPAAPTALGHSSVTNMEIVWTWTNPSGSLTDSYLYWEVGSVCGAATKIDIGSVVSTYTLTGLTLGTGYCAYVEAVGSGGTSAASGVATAMTSGGAVVTPNPPTGLQVTGQSGSSIAISWVNPTTPFTNITLYWAFVGTCSDRPNTNSLGVHTTSYAVTGLPSETEYCFVLQSFNGSTASNRSSTVIGSTLAPGQSSGGGGNNYACPSNPSPIGCSEPKNGTATAPFAYLTDPVFIAVAVLGVILVAGFGFVRGLSRYVRRRKP